MPEPIPVLVALAALGAAACAAHQLRKTRRALEAERAARRLTDGMRRRDMEAFMSRLRQQVQAEEVLAEANRILDAALATHHRPEGGPQ